jgi:hypothetical protein
VSDRHTRVLRVLARHRQRRLDGTTGSGPSAPVSDVRRIDLERMAKRAKARVVASDARRRQPPGSGSVD